MHNYAKERRFHTVQDYDAQVHKTYPIRMPPYIVVSPAHEDSDFQAKLPLDCELPEMLA